MRLKIPLAPLCPPQRHFHRTPHPPRVRRILRTLIKRHDDVSSQPNLYLHRFFGTEKMRRPIQMRTERRTLLAYLPQLIQTENLKPARVRQNGPIPRHEPVQPAHLPHRLHPRTQIKVVRIPQQNLDAQFLQRILRDALNRPHRPHRHKHRRLHLAVRSDQFPRPRRAASRFYLKLNRHRRDSKGL